MNKYKTYVISIFWIYGITSFFLSIQSIAHHNLLDNFSLSQLTTIGTAFLSYFTLLNIVNVSFLVSLLFLCVYGFKWLSDKGAYYTIQYSWQKNKRHVLFFLPKYWGSSTTKEVNKKEDIDLESGEKIYHSLEEFIDYKQTTRWHDINQLFASAITVALISLALGYFV